MQVKLDGKIQRPPSVPLGVIPGASHYGDIKGIMSSITVSNANSYSVVNEILYCLKVNSVKLYNARITALDSLTNDTQSKDTYSKKHRYTMIVFMINDDQGDPVNDFDLFILAGENYNPDKLPKGFAKDRQRNNNQKNHIVYYLDYDVMTSIKDGLKGFRIIARPQKPDNFSYYYPVEYRAGAKDLAKILKPNETLYLEIVLHRYVDKEVFRLDDGDKPQQSFKDTKPSGETIDY